MPITPGNFVTEGTTDKIGVTLAVKQDQYGDANPLVLVRWIADLSLEWIRSEYLYLAERQCGRIEFKSTSAKRK